MTGAVGRTLSESSCCPNANPIYWFLMIRKTVTLDCLFVLVHRMPGQNLRSRSHLLQPIPKVHHLNFQTTFWICGLVQSRARYYLWSPSSPRVLLHLSFCGLEDRPSGQALLPPRQGPVELLRPFHHLSTCHSTVYCFVACLEYQYMLRPHLTTRMIRCRTQRSQCLSSSSS